MGSLSKDFFSNFFQEELYIVRNGKINASAPPIDENKPLPMSKPLIIHGNKESEVLVVLNYEKGGFIPSRDKTLLDNILKAVGLEFDNIGWCSIGDHDHETWNGILDRSEFKKVLSFGSWFDDRLDSEPGAMYRNKAGKRVVCSWPLNEVMPDINKKKELWKALKKMFDL